MKRVVQNVIVPTVVLILFLGVYGLLGGLIDAPQDAASYATTVAGGE